MFKFKLLGTLPAFNFNGFKGTQCPTPVLMDDHIKIYFTARNEGNSLPFVLTVSRDNPLEVRQLNTRPLLELGTEGTFDHNGVMCSQVVQEEEDQWKMYYTGWERFKESPVRFRTACGEATVKDGKWVKDGLFWDRSSRAPYGTSMPFVTNANMYFHGIVKWENNEPFYNIQDYDGVIFDLKEGEGGLTRPVELAGWQGLDLLFYSYRKAFGYRSEKIKSYKLGYGVLDWLCNCREDDITIKGDEDSFMQCFGYPLLVDDKLYLFYNSGSFNSPIHVAIYA